MPHIAEEFMIGNTHVQIATDYCENKTPEEVQAILDKIASDAVNYFIADAIAKQKIQGDQKNAG